MIPSVIFAVVTDKLSLALSRELLIRPSQGALAEVNKVKHVNGCGNGKRSIARNEKERNCIKYFLPQVVPKYDI